MFTQSAKNGMNSANGPEETQPNRRSGCALFHLKVLPCSLPSSYAAARGSEPATHAVLPCWGREGLDVVAALGGQMFPVLQGDFTFVGDLLIIFGELVLLKCTHAVLMLRAYHGCCNCRRAKAYVTARRIEKDLMSPDTRRHQRV
eukprot:s1005_g20.t1